MEEWGSLAVTADLAHSPKTTSHQTQEMTNPAAFERELRAIFGHIQQDTKIATHGSYSFNDVEAMSPLFRCSSKPLAAPTLLFPGLDDALLKRRALRAPNYSCGI